ncbi:hypothetical protein JTE90_003834 [Oedothorax gibbosus]|uniref:Uncharacterized protein n=1 Tax=Oedothorax gibbosus TaxID=931172 RepID=A0AAV6TFH6_9ARAC|nr:hypothetical protein JTE90_003834 [Oedothorax gibbosus]
MRSASSLMREGCPVSGRRLPGKEKRVAPRSAWAESDCVYPLITVTQIERSSVTSCLLVWNAMAINDFL